MKWLIAIACLTAFSTPAAAQSTSPIPSIYGEPIGIDQAQAIIQRGLEEGARRGLPLAIAVVEPSGELVAFARMDGVPYGSIPLAQDKARTSARFRTTTVSREEQVNNGRYALLTADDFVAIGGRRADHSRWPGYRCCWDFRRNFSPGCSRRSGYLWSVVATSAHRPEADLMKVRDESRTVILSGLGSVLQMQKRRFGAMDSVHGMQWTTSLAWIRYFRCRRAGLTFWIR